MKKRHHWVRGVVLASALISAAFLPFRTVAQQQREPQQAQQAESQQSQQAPPKPAPQIPDTAKPSLPGAQMLDQQFPGSISGTVVDRSASAVPGARVKLSREGQATSQEVATGDDGQFSFANVAPGQFQLTILSAGFATQTFSGTLHSGESFEVPQIGLAVATNLTEVQVVVPRTELAEVQLKEEEKQRVLGMIPNFYVTYDPHAAPLTSRQKFHLAWRVSIDPVTFGMIGAIAGIQQASDQLGGYGQGAQGYGKRYGANYADATIGTFMGSAILPSLLKQDPRYFYKGTGSKRSRFLYAVANAVICKGDNGHWQVNYSSILGSLAAGGISNLYYPASDRNGVGLTFENAAIGIGTGAAANLLQEFVIRKLTPNLPGHQSGKP
ncbi:MAG: carboxypeptidase-like regulatory domain-containing protein [Candidatus Acidiferrales bacterium]